MNHDVILSNHVLYQNHAQLKQNAWKQYLEKKYPHFVLDTNVMKSESTKMVSQVTTGSKQTLVLNNPPPLISYKQPIPETKWPKKMNPKVKCLDHIIPNLQTMEPYQLEPVTLTVPNQQCDRIVYEADYGKKAVVCFQLM